MFQGRWGHEEKEKKEKEKKEKTKEEEKERSSREAHVCPPLLSLAWLARESAQPQIS